MDLKKAFGKAMKGEIEGRELYSSAADKSDDKKAKQVFKYLAEEENKHFEALKSMYDSIVGDNKIIIPEIPRLVSFDDAESPIFSRDFKKRIAGRHFEMSALSLALRLEHDSTKYYREMANDAADDDLKEFFNKLADWENDHYEALYNEITFLEDDYYESNNFSPF